MSEPAVRRIPPLCCPQCGSNKVSKGFTKTKNGSKPTVYSIVEAA